MAIFISVFTTGFGLEKEDLFELLLNETLTFMESDYFSVRTEELCSRIMGVSKV